MASVMTDFSSTPPSECAMKRIKVVHVIGGFNRGGVEAWLLTLARTIDRERFQIDFIVNTTSPCVYDDAIYQCGSRIISCAHPSKPWRYGRRFRAILDFFGPYDVIHSHVHYFSGYILRLAEQASIRGRVVHSHSDTSLIDGASSLPRMLYLAAMRREIRRYATAGVAASRKAAAALYGAQWRQDPRWQILYCGIDLAPFHGVVDYERVREEHGIPKDGWVVGHVGSFTAPKNHPFLIRLGLEVLKRVPNSYLLMVGDGPLRLALELDTAKSPLRNRVRFFGNRDDVPRLLMGAMDAFLFPSLWEGLPLSLIEAQAAGLPCIISDVITEEADVVPEAITRLSLDASMERWVDAVLRTRNWRLDRQRARFSVANSPFNSETSTRELEKLYATL